MIDDSKNKDKKLRASDDEPTDAENLRMLAESNAERQSCGGEMRVSCAII